MSRVSRLSRYLHRLNPRLCSSVKSVVLNTDMPGRQVLHPDRCGAAAAPSARTDAINCPSNCWSEARHHRFMRQYQRPRSTIRPRPHRWEAHGNSVRPDPPAFRPLAWPSIPCALTRGHRGEKLAFEPGAGKPPARLTLKIAGTAKILDLGKFWDAPPRPGNGPWIRRSSRGLLGSGRGRKRAVETPRRKMPWPVLAPDQGKVLTNTYEHFATRLPTQEQGRSRAAYDVGPVLLMAP
jgi:hypothetical protein